MPRVKGSPFRSSLEGKKFGEWLVLRRIKGSLWLCKCSCNTEHMIMGNTLTLGKSTKCKSCAQVKHDMAGTKIYYVWAGMKQRCNNQKYHGYDRYGGRGITVCNEWNTFEGFYADMGDKPKNKSLGRIDNDGNYCKENCRWETPKQQIRNRSNTKYYEYEGEKVTLGHLADKKKMPVKQLRYRIEIDGLSIDEAMAKPYNQRKILLTIE